jgi:molybdenum cofactor cytidylyltransferase
MSAGEIACVVLASGLSKRFGSSDKLNADLCGKPVLSHVLDTVTAMGFGDVFCIAKAAGPEKIDWVKNINPERGQGYSLRLGLEAVRIKGWRSCAVILGDMPLVPTSHLQKLIENYTIDQSVISMSESLRMPPAIFNEASMELLLTQSSGVTARSIFDRLNLKTLELDKAFAQDVDTYEDLIRVREVMNKHRV